jgi:hypothetical protein
MDGKRTVLSQIENKIPHLEYTVFAEKHGKWKRGK